jgi:release factor glutamine methyltransferase
VTPYVPTSELHLLPADVQRYEPRVALDGGRDGLDVVRRAIQDAGRLLRPDGWFLTEIGGDQEEPAGRALAAAGFGPAGAWRDADGDLRGLGAQLRSRPGRATTPYG